ncbi:MAG: competence/damage-inducible protein A [Bacteroidales bacterium]|nr:competence/damage-inducible protein A [Bacteroidales bacterium]
MQATIIAIGDELLIGKVVNTNAAYIARKLNLIGISVKEAIVIGDNKQHILSSLENAHRKSDVIILTGGLGPTSDDITKPALCEYFGSKLEFRPDVLEQVKAFLDKRGGVLNDLNKSQAWVPDNCTLLNNPIGTAPGMFFEKEGRYYFALPGVPFEMEKMFDDHVIPILSKKAGIENIYHRTILTTGISESKLAETISEWEKSLPSFVKLAYLPSPGIVKVRLSVYHNPHGKEIIEDAERRLHAIIAPYIFGYDDDTLEGIVGHLLMSQNATLATAESCTGGNLSLSIVSVPGASAYYKGGIIAYSNEIKINELNVNPDIINHYGAVSQQTAEAMAKGCLNKFETHYSVAVTGIAGPDGGSPEKPVGTVWIAVASPKNIVSEKFLFGDNRIRNIQRSTIAALNMLRKTIEIK